MPPSVVCGKISHQRRPPTRILPPGSPLSAVPTCGMPSTRLFMGTSIMSMHRVRGCRSSTPLPATFPSDQDTLRIKIAVQNCAVSTPLSYPCLQPLRNVLDANQTGDRVAGAAEERRPHRAPVMSTPLPIPREEAIEEAEILIAMITTLRLAD